MNRGYIALWRKSQDHPFYKERRVFSKWEAWVDILMEVQHSPEPQEVAIGMDIFICNYGESLNSLRTWAIRWGWSPTKVNRLFKFLIRLKQINVKNEIVTTRITVLNYSKYDPKCNGNVTRPKHDRNVTETLPLTDKNVKNVKNDNNIKKKIKKKSFSPPTMEDVKLYFFENGYLESAGEKAFNFYNTASWIDSKGNPVKNWKQKMIGVWFKDENKINKPVNGKSTRLSRSEQNAIACQQFIEGAGNEK